MVEKRDGRSESPNRCEVLVAMFSFKTQTKPHAKKTLYRLIELEWTN